MATKATKDTAIYIPEIDRERLELCLLGMSPFIFNRMSEKAKRQLILPPKRKNAAERATTLKHNPLEEFRASPYVLPEGGAPTLLAMPSSAFKGAMAAAAVDLPGISRAQIGRLLWVEGEYVGIYGVPKLNTKMVRTADMARTPDMRSRATLPYWAARITVSYVRPHLTSQAVVNLLTAAGVTIGVGDWRSEKGKGNYGQFEIVNEDDAQFQLVTSQGRAAQIAAMNEPEFYDQETADLIAWWAEEATARGFEVA